jgi:predicted ATPase
VKIKLNNIGLINNSTICLDGLTIITGKNNSGKTTVGKALYSLIDAVSNLTSKASYDRNQYIVNQLDSVAETMEFMRYFVFSNDFDDNSENISFMKKYPALVSLFSREFRHEISLTECENIAIKLQQELDEISPSELINIKDIHYYVRKVMNRKKDNETTNNILQIIEEQIIRAKSILSDMFVAINKDSQLIDYARESINQTLKLEFSGQIQPASFDVEDSEIEITDESKCCFNIKIINNSIKNSGEPVFYTSPYKKALFIDNPFVLDEINPVRRFIRNSLLVNTESILNPHNIVSHNQKLRYILRDTNQPSIFEQTLINDNFRKVKQDIDSIIPGTFEFSSSGDFYIQNGNKLRVSNLATGSKMFSIIKILLEKGYLGKETILILDEPEAHLHPSWQNRFAEMIVLLVKELDVNIVLTTHSSNFVLALDAYMRKYDIEDKTNFYRTDTTEDGHVDYSCINKDIGSIYQDFLQYFSEVKVLRNLYLKDSGE